MRRGFVFLAGMSRAARLVKVGWCGAHWIVFIDLSVREIGRCYVAQLDEHARITEGFDSGDIDPEGSLQRGYAAYDAAYRRDRLDELLSARNSLTDRSLPFGCNIMLEGEIGTSGDNRSPIPARESVCRELPLQKATTQVSC
jgi:hypothetical protein